jgi:hypothetical protein
MTRALLSSVLIGHADPWKHPEFLAYREGFDVTVFGWSKFIDVRLCCSLIRSQLMKSSQTFSVAKDGPSYLHLLIAGMYNRRITDVKQILERLSFSTAADESEVNILLFDIFQLRMKRYLIGVSHPLPLKGTAISLEDFAKDSENHLLRCHLFLLAISDSDLLPLDAQTKFEVKDLPPS